jgi:nucleoside-diphosphate-sugar epimerase
MCGISARDVAFSAGVTGAGGFIGAHAVRGFEARGAVVTPFVRAADGSPRSRVLEAALHDPAMFAGLDVVVHAAAVRHRYGADPLAYQESNVELVERCMRACGAAGVRRFVLVSSVGVYGFPSKLPVTEASGYAPRTLYSATKVEAELRARRLAADLHMELVVARPTIVYGRGDRNGMLEKMAAMIRAGTYRIVGSGRNVLHHAHVDDVVEGLWLTATRREAAGQGFILAGPETTTLSALSSLVAEATGSRLRLVHVPLAVARAAAAVVDVAAYRALAYTEREPPINSEKLDVMTLPIRFDTLKARRALGYAPTVGYARGVTETLRGP